MKPFLALFLFLAVTLAQADKPTLAITPVNVSPPLLQNDSRDDYKVALARVTESLQQQLTAAFGNTGKFNVVSRTDLPSVVQEQIIGQSGNINPDSAAEQGVIKGASYVLVVDILDFQLFVERARFQSIARDQQRAILSAATVSRIYDSTTGELLASSRNEVSGEDFQQYFAFAARQGDLETAIYTQAANSLAEDIATSMTNRLFPAKVVAKTGEQITINRGSSNSYYSTNQMLTIFAVGESMLDPDTGESLGLEEIFLGQAAIIRVNERTTIAILREDNGVEVGHIVRQ